MNLGPGLTPREAAADAVHRMVQALDDNDEALMRSAFLPDGVFDLSGLSAATGQSFPPQEGIEAIVNGVLAHLSTLDSGHHLSNFRVKLNDAADQAEVHCYAMAQHFRKGEGHDARKRDYVLYGNAYWADVVKDGTGEDAFWRIRRFEIRNLWVEGEPSVTAP